MSVAPLGQSNPYAYSPPAAADADRNKGTAPAAAGSGAVDDSKKAQTSPEDAFLDFAKMSLPEKIRYQYLAAHGLTEDDLKAMDEKERQKVEDQIREEIEQAVKKATEKKIGGIADIKA